MFIHGDILVSLKGIFHIPVASFKHSNSKRAPSLRSSLKMDETVDDCWQVVNHSISPEWKEAFTWAFDVPPKGQKLHIICKSKNTFGKVIKFC